MDHKKLIVQKFGGSSLASPEQIKKIAAKIAEQHRAGFHVIVVVSAMGKTTDGLMKLAHEVSAVPNRRELDMLLSTGERISMALLSMALHDLNCPSISFTGSQAGVMTDGSHSNAVIKEIKPIRVDEALEQNKVVVLAGFQGVDPVTKEITTLGRGGSDTTAVSMAAHFKAERCEILKDVDGVYSADPRIVSSAKLLKEVPGDSLMEMCRWGAKVLHYRSVEVALKARVPLAIGRSDNFAVGTRVIYSVGAGFYAVNSIHDVHQLSVQAPSIDEALKHLYMRLDSHKLPYPEILDCEMNGENAHLTYYSDVDSLNAMRKIFTANIVKLEPQIFSSVTVTGVSKVDGSFSEKFYEVLSDAGIQSSKAILTPYSVSFLVPQEMRVKAVQALHDAVQG